MMESPVLLLRLSTTSAILSARYIAHFMLSSTARLGLPAPSFRETGEFIVTFQKAPALLSLVPHLPPSYKAEPLWSEGEQEQPEIVIQNRQTEQREQRLVKAVSYVHEHNFITNAIYRQLIGVSYRTATRDLETLVERGRIKGTGQRAARRYVQV